MADSTEELTGRLRGHKESLNGVGRRSPTQQEQQDQISGKAEAAARLLPHGEYLKLVLLEKLAGRVERFATVLQGDSGQGNASNSADDMERDKSGPPSPVNNSNNREDGRIAQRLKVKMQSHD